MSLDEAAGSVIEIDDDEPETETINEGAAAPALQVLPKNDQRLFWKLLEMFPNVSRDYLNLICQGKTYNDSTFAEILDLMLGTDYPKAPPRSPSPKISVTHEEQLAMLKEMVPDADPTFLETKVQELSDNKDARLEQFIENMLTTKNYPSKKDYVRRTQLCAQQQQYTTQFNVERFVQLFPNPKAIFEAPNRITPALTDNDVLYISICMRRMYPQLYARDIQEVQKTTHSIRKIIQKLDKLVAAKIFKKVIRAVPVVRPSCQNIPLLQELAYFEHKHEILNYIEEKKIQDAEERLQAKKMGLLQTCSCCFDEEIMPNDIVTCPEGCRFCKFCVKRSSEIAVGENKMNFPCLSGNCNTEFSLLVLQSVLEPKVFSKIAQKKALAEVKAVLHDELESCPFCDFANIPAPGDQLFRCLNPDCMKESCRSCKERSHIPLRCDEVEKDEQVQARTYIENKMTEALIRECWKCGNRFYKEEGCNKMTCFCGAMTCYVCRKPVRNYDHFKNGQNTENRSDLCPLYTDNFTVNENKVLEAAEIAKKEVGQDKLKHDPTDGLDNYLKAKKAKSRHVQQVQALGIQRPLPPNFPRAFEQLIPLPPCGRRRNSDNL